MNLGMGVGVGFTRKAGSVLFTPASDSSIKAWYHFGAGVTTSGGNVTALADQSGTGDANKNLAKFGTADIVFNASDPAYGGRPTATTSTADSRLQGAANWASALPSPMTIYAVGHVSNDGGRIYDSISGRVMLVRLTSKWNIYAGSSFLNAASSSPGTPSVMCAVYNGASSALYIGGDLSSVAASGNAGTDTANRFGLFDLPGGGGPMIGTIAEVIICAGVHDAAKRAQYATYLAKYGL